MLVRKLLRLLIMELSTKMLYRADLGLWLLAEMLTPLVSLAVWYTVAKSSSALLSPADAILYYILVIFVIITTQAWNGYFLAREILTGELAKLLVKPLPVLWHHIGDNITEKIAKLLIPIPLLVIAVLLFPEFFSTIHHDPLTLVAAAISLLLAAIISFTFDLSLGMLAFWFEDANQLREYQFIFREVTSGVIIPFIFLPPLVQNVFSWFPFRYMISAPIEILLGMTSGVHITSLLGIQLAWVLGLCGVMAILWNRGLKRYAVPGQ